MAIIRALRGRAGLLLTNFASRGLVVPRVAAGEARGSHIQLTIQGKIAMGDSSVDYTVNPAMGLCVATGPPTQRILSLRSNHVLPRWDQILPCPIVAATCGSLPC